MIRFRCPSCDKRLNVDDARAGQGGICPQCRSKLRIPAEPTVTEPPSKAVEKARLNRKEDMPRRAVKARSIADEDDRKPPSEEAEQAPVRKKKKKRRKQSSGVLFGLGGFSVGLLGLAAISIICLVAGFIWPAVLLLPMLLGLVLSVVGGIWFLALAFQDSSLQGLLCLLVPFYSLYYLIMHFEEVKRPFFVQLIGVLVIGASSCAGTMSASNAIKNSRSLRTEIRAPKILGTVHATYCTTEHCGHILSDGRFARLPSRFCTGRPCMSTNLLRDASSPTAPSIFETSASRGS